MGILRSNLPYDLRRRGQLDSNRHQKKIRDAIKKNLHRIIAEEAIITTDGKRTTRVPVKYLDSYHFRHGYPKDGAGHGEGEEGDILKKGEKEGEGEGKKAGNQRGIDIYDAEVSVDDLTQMMLEDLGLPWMEKKDKMEIVTTETKFTDLRKKGIMSNWSKRATVMENIKRNAKESNDPKCGNLKNEDMRYRTWDEVIQTHSNAVVYLMMDRSGSMDDHKRYLCKATFWWICRFLERKYDNVEVVFIAHDTEAQVVPEKDFFAISSSGGTMCSSAYNLCWKDIKEFRPQNIWNVYVFHFSDGDNWGDDDKACVNVVKEMLGRVNMLAYGEVDYDGSEYEEEKSGDNDAFFELSSSLMRAFKEGVGDHPRMLATRMSRKSDVYKTLKAFLGVEEAEK